MDKRIIVQLTDRAEAFNKIQIKPVICGGRCKDQVRQFKTARTLTYRVDYLEGQQL